MTSGISGALAGAISRRSTAGLGDLGHEGGRSNPESVGGSIASGGRHQDRDDPLGLREAWIKARSAVQRYAEREKASMTGRKQITGNQGKASSAGLDRIKSRLEQMRRSGDRKDRRKSNTKGKWNRGSAEKGSA